MSVKHKYPNTIQVGDRVKYGNGIADYFVIQINKCGKKCDIKRNNDFENVYDKVLISKLVILEKNPKILSHKEIKEATLNKEYYAKTNPHKKVAGYMSKPKIKEPIEHVLLFKDSDGKVYRTEYSTDRDEVAEMIRKHFIETINEAEYNPPEVRTLTKRKLKVNVKTVVDIK